MTPVQIVLKKKLSFLFLLKQRNVIYLNKKKLRKVLQFELFLYIVFHPSLNQLMIFFFNIIDLHLKFVEISLRGPLLVHLPYIHFIYIIYIHKYLSQL